MKTPRHRFVSACLLATVAVLAGAFALSGAASADNPGPTPTGPPTTNRPAPIVYRPAGLSTANKVPLLIALYGTQGCPQCMEGLTHFEAVANQNGFVVAYPGSGLVNGSPWESVSDIPYIKSLISQIETSQNIDPSRVYVVGFSAGGRFVYQLGCALSSQITAIAIVSSVQRPYSCSLTHPVSELSVMGSLEAGLVNGIASKGIPSNNTVESWWRQRDGCGAAPSNASSGPVSEQKSGPCVDGSEVALYVVQGGHHTWPGCSCKLAPSDPDAHWNASAGIWAWLSNLRAGSLSTPDAGLTGLRFAAPSRHARFVRARYSLGETVTLTETFVAHGRKVLGTKVVLQAGSRLVTLKLPAKVKRGKYVLRLQVTDSYGRTLKLSRTVRVTK